MYFAERVRETTTTTGTGTVTLAGAVAQHQTFTSRVITGDQCEYVLVDANGTGWEVGIGTLATTATLSRDTILQSSNSDTAITLSSGTHSVFLTGSGTNANKRVVQADSQIDYVASGLLAPGSSGTLALTISAGVAYVIGQRVVKGAQAHTYGASTTTYVDLSNTGVYTYTTSTGLTANSIRIAKVVSGGSTITSTQTTGFDSIGNVIRNRVAVPTCSLIVAGAGATSHAGISWEVQTFGSGSTLLNNDLMHSETVNTSRITAQRDGLFSAKCSAQFGSGSATSGLYAVGIVQNGAGVGTPVTPNGGKNDTVPLPSGAWEGWLNASEYLEVYTLNSGNDQTMYNLAFSATKIG